MEETPNINEAKSIEIKMRTSAAQAHELLERLAHDPAFRQSMQDDPQNTLMQYGIEISEESAQEFVELPDPEEIDGLLMKLGEYGIAPGTRRSLGWIAIVEAYAMPLVVTAPAVDDEG